MLSMILVKQMAFYGNKQDLFEEIPDMEIANHIYQKRHEKSNKHSKTNNNQRFLTLYQKIFVILCPMKVLSLK